jgi:hypothetical protein
MEKLPDINREFLAKEAKKIIDFANSNIVQINGQDPQGYDCTEEYYLGMLRRQTILLYDIETLLDNSQHQNLTTLAILCRCLLDDFLTVVYLKTKPNESDNILCITGKAFRHTFDSLEVLTKSNDNHFNGKYTYYLTQEELEANKITFKDKPKNKGFFVDGNDFPLKGFKQFTNMYKEIDGFELTKITSRSFYLWKEFSDFVHYSTITYNLEVNKSNEQTYFRSIEETLYNSLNTIEMSFRYFVAKYNLEFKIDADLNDRYLMNIMPENV